MEEAPDADDSGSGSQVIALDTEGDDQAGMLGGASGSTMAAMLDEDVTAQPSLDMGLGAPMGSPLLGPQPGGLAESVPMMQAAAVLPEGQYSRLANHRPGGVRGVFDAVWHDDVRQPAQHVELGRTLFRQ